MPRRAACATGSDGPAIAYDVAVSPDGSKVIVTGYTTGEGRDYLGNPTVASDYLTVAYDAATGGEIWAGVYGSVPGGSDSAAGVAVDAAEGSGVRIFVTGSTSVGGMYSPDTDMGTVAYFNPWG